MFSHSIKSQLLVIALLLVLGLAGHEWFGAPTRSVAPVRIIPSNLEIVPSHIPPVAELQPVQDDIRASMSTPSWMVKPGREFWRRAAGATLPPSEWSHHLQPLAARDVQDRVRHAFRSEATELGGQVISSDYEAVVDPTGVRFTPGITGPSVAAKNQPATADFPLQFRTQTMSWGQESLVTPGTDTGPWAFMGNTAQRLLSSELGWVEHVEARAEGLELTWLMHRPLSGEDPVILEVAATGFSSWTQTETGVHFADANGAARVRLGPVQAVDQSGQTWRLPLEIQEHTLRIEVPGQLMAQASFPLAIDPVISPEFGVDQPVLGLSARTEGPPVLAANAAGFLVVWPRGKSEIGGAAVCAARVSHAGELLDPHGLIVGTIAAEQTRCAVAAVSNHFMVVWSGPHGTSTSDWDIFAARVLDDGTVLDDPPLPVCTQSGVQATPAVAANGTNFLAVWRDSRGTGIYGARLSTEGNIWPTNGVPIGTASNDQFTPALAALEGNYLVVWQDYRRATSAQYYADIYGARVSGDGQVLDVNGVAICTRTNSQYYPAVAANGTNYLVVWEDFDVGGYDIWGARVDAQGTVLDSAGFVLAHGGSLQARPSVTGLGGRFLVAWQDHRNSTASNFVADILGAHVLTGGPTVEIVLGGITMAEGNQYAPSVTSWGEQWMAAWQDTRLNPGTTWSDVYGKSLRIAEDGLPVPNLRITPAVNEETAPVVASSGTNYLVVWADDRHYLTNGLDIVGARIGSDGTLLDPMGMVICAAPQRQAEPAVAGFPMGYLVAWADWRHTPASASHADIYGALVTRDGERVRLDEIPICIATNDQRAPAVTAMAEDLRVAWQDARSSTASTVRWDIYGARLDFRGQPLTSADLAICTASGNQISPALAAGPGKTLVVWADYRRGATSDLYGALIDAQGQVQDTNGFPICLAVNSQLEPAVAAKDTEFLVAWSDARQQAVSGYDIYGMFIPPEGLTSPADGFPFQSQAGHQGSPTVIACPLEYVVFWQSAPAASSGRFRLEGSRVSRGWASPITIALPLESVPASLGPPALAAGDSRQSLAVFAGVQFSRSRTMAFPMELDPFLSLEPRFGMTSAGWSTVQVFGEAGLPITLEVSEDLKTWSRVATAVLVNGGAQIVDPDSQGKSHRFYRVIITP